MEREFPLVFTLDALWKPTHELVLLAGPGFEIETEESFFVFRLGFEYEIEFGGHWDVSPSAFYDYRADAFGTWSIGLGVGKRF